MACTLQHCTSMFYLCTRKVHKSKEDKMNTDVIIKVTRIKNRYHSRLIAEGVAVREMACVNKCDIGWISREILRWYDKLGGVSKFAAAARVRQRGKPIGKVWYCKQLKAKDSSLR